MQVRYTIHICTGYVLICSPTVEISCHHKNLLLPHIIVLPCIVIPKCVHKLCRYAPSRRFSDFNHHPACMCIAFTQLARRPILRKDKIHRPKYKITPFDLPTWNSCAIIPHGSGNASKMYKCFYDVTAASWIPGQM